MLELGGNQQVRLDVARQVLDDALPPGARTLTEVRTEAIEDDEAHLLGVRHDHAGHHTRFQAAHSIAQHDGRYAAQFREAFGQ